MKRLVSNCILLSIMTIVGYVVYPRIWAAFTGSTTPLMQGQGIDERIARLNDYLR